ncbi:unnamed protein product [Miscanthus lutarioriparius]|uniref:Uncharacterized protein n=1 Tax=Miscanthus lutarioriparius TaxID=422564 RepID=A0A811QAV5_9POAL|nr:unnamed protein product [Miscanthus lutarioriparius]
MAVDDWLLDDSSMRGCEMYEGEDLGHKVKAWAPAMAQRLGAGLQVPYGAGWLERNMDSVKRNP